MKKGINLLLTIATSLSGVALASCLTACPNTDDTDAKPTSLKSTLKYLYENKNYTLISNASDKIISHQLVYTENYMGRVSQESPEITKLYNSDENGTYCLEFNQDTYVASEYRSDKNVWESKLFPSFYHESEKFINSIKDDATTVNVTDKNYKIVLVQMMGYKSTDVLNLSDVTISYSDATGAVIAGKYKNINFSYTVGRIGTSKSTIVTNYVSEGGVAYSPTAEQRAMREGMRSNNYAQSIYNFGETSESTGFIGDYAFNPHYFFTKYYGGTDWTGYISLDCPESTDPEDTHGELHGVFLFTVISGELKINPNYISNNPNIVEVMTYPSKLSLLDNLQLLEPWKGKYVTGFTKEGVGYTTTNSKIIKDFSANFNMDNSFQGQQPVAVSVDIVMEEGLLKKVTFYYTMSVAGTQYVYPIPFYAFGQIGQASLDQVWEHYNYKLN